MDAVLLMCHPTGYVPNTLSLENHLDRKGKSKLLLLRKHKNLQHMQKLILVLKCHRGNKAEDQCRSCQSLST